jgi:membrane protease YdiL (CAAX protease family)
MSADDPEEDEPTVVADEGEDPDAARFRTVALAVLVEGGLILLALLLGWLFDKNALSRLRLDLAGVGWGLAAALPMLAAFFVMRRWPVGPLAGLKKFSDDLIRPMMRPLTTVDLLGISCLAGLGEEMLFRGVAQDFFAGYLSRGWAVAAASLMFGVVHAITPTYFVLASLAGAYLGWVYALTGDIAAPIVAHAAYDFVALLVLVRDDDAAV